MASRPRKKPPASKKSVGIRELKNRASALVDFVARTRTSIPITKNGKKVAELVPVVDSETDPGERFYQAMEAMGMKMRRGSGRPISEWLATPRDYEVPEGAYEAAMKALQEDRDDG